jgi:hypothetical protein
VALAQAPILAVLIVVFFGRQAAAPVAAESLSSVGDGIASTLFALVLAAVWLGCSLAVAERAAERSPQGPADVDAAEFLAAYGSRLGVLVALCALGCALAMVIVCWGSELKGSWMSMWGIMLMTSMVGLMLGLVVTMLSPTLKTAAVVLLIAFAPMVALGGPMWPLRDPSSPARLAAAAMPTRWAFEGLLLLESAQNPATVAAAGSGATQGRDLVEYFFPADSERMGTKADTMALGSMLIGLAALAVFTSRLRSQRHRAAPLTLALSPGGRGGK